MIRFCTSNVVSRSDGCCTINHNAPNRKNQIHSRSKVDKGLQGQLKVKRIFVMTRISLRSVVCVVLGMLLQIATQFLFFRKSVLWFAMGTYFASNYVVGGLAMLFRYPQLAGKNRETGQIHPLGILFWFPTRILQLLIVLFKRYGFVLLSTCHLLLLLCTIITGSVTHFESTHTDNVEIKLLTITTNY